MPKNIPPELRASETVTIRLTRQQKALLERVASALELSVTDVIRSHVFQMAKQLGLTPEEADGATEGLPGRRRSSRPPLFSTPAPSQPPGSLQPGRAAPPVVFGDLAGLYQETFAERGEGTRRELDDAVRYLTEAREGEAEPLLPSGLGIAEITPGRLAALRERLRGAPMRLSRKNLILTYLRMMLHHAFKRRELAFDVAPGAELRAITAAEVADPWSDPAR